MSCECAPGDPYCSILTFCRICEQPLKIPYISAIVLYANDTNGDFAKEVLLKTQKRAQVALEVGEWREFKLLLRFLAGLQTIFDEDGIFDLLENLFVRAADQQAASEDDVSALAPTLLRIF